MKNDIPSKTGEKYVMRIQKLKVKENWGLVRSVKLEKIKVIKIGKEQIKLYSQMT